MMVNDGSAEFYKGLVLGVLAMLLVVAIGTGMRAHRETLALEESNLEWEQQVDKSYELGFKAGTLETLQIIEALTTYRKEDR